MEEGPQNNFPTGILFDIDGTQINLGSLLKISLYLKMLDDSIMSPHKAITSNLPSGILMILNSKTSV